VEKGGLLFEGIVGGIYSYFFAVFGGFKVFELGIVEEKDIFVGCLLEMSDQLKTVAADAGEAGAEHSAIDSYFHAGSLAKVWGWGKSGGCVFSKFQKF